MKKKLKVLNEEQDLKEEKKESPQDEDDKVFHDHVKSVFGDSDLFKDNSYVPNKLVQVKRVNSNKIGENWDIMENGKSVLRLKGDKFTNKEKAFLRTIDGVKFVMEGYKNGWKSLNKFKQEIKVQSENSVQANKKNK